MIFKNRNVLIVGGTGFIGHNLAKNCLKLKFNVFSLSSKKVSKKKKLKKVKYIVGNIKSFQIETTLTFERN